MVEEETHRIKGGDGGSAHPGTTWRKWRRWQAVTNTSSNGGSGNGHGNDGGNNVVVNWGIVFCAGAGANGSNGNGGNGVEIPTHCAIQFLALLDQVQILVDGLLAAVEVVMVTPVHLETHPVTGGAGGGGRGEVGIPPGTI